MKELYSCQLHILCVGGEDSQDKESGSFSSPSPFGDYLKKFSGPIIHLKNLECIYDIWKK